MNKQVKYIPGVCNIGPAEIARRKRSGWVGLIVTLVLWGVFVWFNTPAIFRLLIFFPAMASASGFLQAYMHFCAGFGFKGVYNIMKPAGQTETIMQKEFRAKDRQKALQIFSYSAVIGLVVALITYAMSV